MKSVGRIIRDTKDLWKRLEEHRKERELIVAYRLVEAEFQHYIDTLNWAIEEARENGFEDELAKEIKERDLNILKTLQADREVAVEVRHRCQVEATAEVWSNGNKTVKNIIKKIAM